jgi:CBS domain-containing protein
MAFIPEDLRFQAEKIQRGETSDNVKVRTLLKWFGAQRRGFNVVYQIRRALREIGLGTEPDFRYSWLDGPVRFYAVEPDGDSENPPTEHAANTDLPAVQQSTPEPPTTEFSDVQSVTPQFVGGAVADPTHRIGQLDAANRGVLSVTPDDTIERAMTLMLANNYSQLPVMTSPREVKGVVTWESLGRRAMLAGSCTHVRDCMGRPIEISADTSLFAAIPQIIGHQYVLVRAADKQISGIVTSADLSEQFQRLAEPFLLLGEIENQIRRLVENRFTEEELGAGKDPADLDRTITSVADLSLGECIRLLENEERWRKLGLRIDRTEFIKEAHRVRNIRNDVMHFDPDPMSAEELFLLRRFAQFLSSLAEFFVLPAGGSGTSA